VPALARTLVDSNALVMVACLFLGGVVVRPCGETESAF